jgi:hypothetical protein
MIDEPYASDGGTMLRLILGDWANGGAKVTITTRGGAQFTGTVRRWRTADEPGLVRLDAEPAYDGISRKQVVHDIRLTEIAAITAVAK